MIKKLLKYRFLFEELVKRDFKKKYKRTVLGMFWSVLSPLLTLAVMALVFTHFFGGRVEHYIIYLFSGNLIFTFFNDATNGGMRSLLSNAAIFSKVDVPKYMFLLSRNIQSLINFGLSLIVYFIFVFFDGIDFTWKFLLLIYPVICLVIFNIGVGMILSALYVFFRDVEYLYSIFTMLLMYLSAIFYDVTSFAHNIQMLFYLNPVYCYISYFRKIVILNVYPGWEHNLACIGYSLIVLGIGAFIYKKYNYKFLYYI